MENRDQALWKNTKENVELMLRHFGALTREQMLEAMRAVDKAFNPVALDAGLEVLVRESRILENGGYYSMNRHTMPSERVDMAFTEYFDSFDFEGKDLYDFMAGIVLLEYPYRYQSIVDGSRFLIPIIDKDDIQYFRKCIVSEKIRKERTEEFLEENPKYQALEAAHYKPTQFVLILREKDEALLREIQFALFENKDIDIDYVIKIQSESIR